MQTSGPTLIRKGLHSDAIMNPHELAAGRYPVKTLFYFTISHKTKYVQILQ